MTDIDSDNERQRLAGLYSCMPDEQLQELSGDPSFFTEIARQTLLAEVTRQNLPAGRGEVTESTPPDSNVIEWLEARSSPSIPRPSRSNSRPGNPGFGRNRIFSGG